MIRSKTETQKKYFLFHENLIFQKLSNQHKFKNLHKIDIKPPVNVLRKNSLYETEKKISNVTFKLKHIFY